MTRSALCSVALLATTSSLVAGCGEEPIVAAPSEVTADVAAPPPVSGGTLFVTRDGRFAVVADAAVDQLFVADLEAAEIVQTIALEPGDEPGRVIEGADGQLLVVLRGAGAIARVTLDNGEVERTTVCEAPRGVAFDGAGDRLFVACAGGELVTLDGSLAILSTARLERDLRDVVLTSDGTLAISRFRSAEVLFVEPIQGRVERRVRPPDYQSPILLRNFEPAVAYRLQALPDGSVAMVHQRGLVDPVPAGSPTTGQSNYGGGGICDEVIVHAAITVFSPSQDEPVTAHAAGGIGNVVLPVDLAISPGGDRLAVVGAGNDQLFETALSAALGGDALASCGPTSGQSQLVVAGEPVAVAYGGGGLLVQTRQPAALHILDPGVQAPGTVIALPGPSRRNWGHAVFHRAASLSSPIACASCHAEGREDGRSWSFEGVGLRRTQDLSGGIMATKPFHWDGDLDDMHEFMSEIFVNRMGGAELPTDRLDALETWIDQLERVPVSPGDGDAIARGEALFLGAELACTSCHGGERFTNNTTVDVGTGKPFQVPSLLGLWSRAPYMHDGCAPTLLDRFDPRYSCGGGDLHGKTSQLSVEQLADLVAYLESL